MVTLSVQTRRLESFWRAFSNRGLHLIHLNINGPLPKIDELRDIAKITKAAVIGISESKLDSSVLDLEIYFENYEILHFGTDVLLVTLEVTSAIN